MGQSRKALIHYLVLFIGLICIVASCEVRTLYYYEPVLLENGYIVSVERGGIDKDGINDATMSCYEHWIRSAFYIKTNGAKSVHIPVNNSEQCFVWQYDSDHRTIDIDEMKEEVRLSADCEYIRFQIRANNTPDYVSISLKDAELPPCETKHVQKSPTHERLIYAIDEDIYTTAILVLPPNYCADGDSVPLIIWDSGDGAFVDWDTHEIGDGYIGRINGINYLRDSGFAVLEIYSWGSDYNKKYPNCGRRSAMPIPTHLLTHEKGVEYVLSRFNIDGDNIFHLSKSGSGKLSLYYAMVSPPFNLKAIYSFAPVFDDLNFVGWGIEDYRRALFEELSFVGTQEEINYFIDGEPYQFDVEYIKKHNLQIDLTTSWQMHQPLGRSFIEKNAEKFKAISVDWMNVSGRTLEQLVEETHTFSEIFWEGFTRQYNPEERCFYFAWESTALPALHENCYNRYDLERYGSNIPFTVIMSPTDEQTPYWNAYEVIRQFQNTGTDARMISLKSGGHSGPDLSTYGPNAVKDVKTRLGIHYKSVAIGWYFVVEDICGRHLM